MCVTKTCYFELTPIVVFTDFYKSGNAATHTVIIERPHPIVELNEFYLIHI